MKVLLVNKFHFRKGGGETYYFELARALRAHGHEVVFFSTQDARNEPCEQEGFFARKREYDGKSSPLGRVRDGVAAVYSVEARDKFDALLRRERPDVVHLNLVQRRPTFSLMDAPSLEGVAVVYTAHDYALLCPASLMLDGNGRTCVQQLGFEIVRIPVVLTGLGNVRRSVLPLPDLHAVLLRDRRSADHSLKQHLTGRNRLFRGVRKVLARQIADDGPAALALLGHLRQNLLLRRR